MVKTGGVESTKLKNYIERIERLEEDKAGIASDIRDVKAEAKSNGFDLKAITAILKLRKMNASERTEQEYMLDLYKRALGLDPDMEDEDDHEAALEASEPEPEPEPEDEDALYTKAKKIVIEDKRVSVSYLQRHLKIGFNLAARLIDRLERDSIIGPPDWVGKRLVLEQGEAA